MPDGSSSSQSRFTVLSGSLAGKELVIEQTVENILIGSDSTCRFHLPTPGVSPIHARLWMDASGVTVYDTNSPRGLFVNDDKVKGQSPLRNGDILWLGTPGDDDVVMIQCRLPTREAVTAPPIAEEQPATMILPAAAPSDAEETMMLGASSEEQSEEPVEVQPEETSSEASEEPETIVSGMSFAGAESEEEPEIEAENFEPLGEEAASAESEPEEESAATVEPEPLDESAPTDVPEPEVTLPLGAERRAPTATMSLPDDFMIEETQFIGGPVPTEPPTIPPPAEEPPPAVEEPPVEEPHLGEPPPPDEEAVKFSLDYEQSATAPFSTPVPPHTFEDETGHSAYDSEAPTMMAEPKAAPPVEAALPAAELPATVLAPPPQRYEPPPLVHPPKPVAPRPRPTPSTKAVRPPEFATAGGRSEAGSSPGRSVVFGAVGLVLLGAIGFFGVRFLRGRGATTATTTTPPETVTPTTMAALPPPTTMPPRPVVTPTPPVEETVTVVQPPPPTTLPAPPPAAPSPATVRTMPPAASPAAKATPTPRPAAPATTTPAAPSAEAVRAQQLASLLGQADAAVSAHNYDSAAGLYDQALKLDPQSSKASAGKAAALASAGALKKTFVAGRTSVQSGKMVKKTVAGFDSEDVSVGKAPDYSGRIEFEVSPRNVKPGDSYSARVFLSNDGKKAFKISTLNVVTSTNGSESGGQSSPPVKEVQPQQRVSLKEVSGVWQEGTSSWNLEVAVVSDRGDVFKNTVTWR